MKHGYDRLQIDRKDKKASILRCFNLLLSVKVKKPRVARGFFILPSSLERRREVFLEIVRTLF
ncbi:hypothetical protein DLM77_18770 [Leptospira yasudae]|uniref:Uncharacterized protein n=1 Tax=Leptospira yasudae TaxID=2202201 RepID=A0ABX9LZL0_9LEPT|nr:hypothetical protein DLM77_18770 [Leptospira yasudae]